MRALLLSCCLLLSVAGSHAADEPLRFDDPVKQQRYQHLLEELRCLVCQNQTLADSHADLAQDLRKEVHKMVDAGQADEHILEFLVSRYGDFVLYRPPLNRTTLLLWFGPFVILFLALFGVYRFVRTRRSAGVIVNQSDRERLSRLLDESPDR